MERQRNDNRAIVGTALSYAAVPLAAVVTGPVLARSLGTTQRGELAAILAPTSLVLALFSVGVPSALTYFTARCELSVRRAARLAWLLGALTGGLAGLVLWFLAPILLHSDPSLVPLFRLTAILIVPAGIAAALRGVHQGLGDFGRLNRERWIGLGIRFAPICGLAVLGALTVRSAVLTTILATIFASTILLRKLRTERPGRVPASREAPFGRVARYSGVVAVGAMSGTVIIRLDQTVMPILSNAHALGLYAVAVSVAELPLFASIAVRDVVLTAAAERSSGRLVAEAARGVLVIQLALAALLAPILPLVIPLAFGHQFRGAVAPAEILLLAGALGAPGSVLNNGLLSQGAAGRRSAAQAGAAVVTVVALVAFVPPFGAVGAALASLCAYLFSSLANGVLLARLGGLPYSECLVPRACDFAGIAQRVKRGVFGSHDRRPERAHEPAVATNLPDAA